jgi:trehalose utilization protein
VSPNAAPRVLVWNEHVHEREEPAVAGLYPDAIHGRLAEIVRGALPGAQVGTATLADTPDHGLTEAALASTDVLLWWGHVAQLGLSDTAAERVRRHVLAGMGFVVLHSGHLAPPFRMLMGTSCNLRWREGSDRELIWTVAPGHPIARGVPSPLVLDRHETYSEYFDIPPPDELVFVSSFSGGEVLRGGCCFRRGAGRIFYFSPGHETYPVYHHGDVARVIGNAVSWAAADGAARLDTLDDSHWSPEGWWEARAGRAS